MKPESNKSGLTGWVLAIIRAMRACGIDVEAVLKDIGMNPALLEGGYGRYWQDQISELWRKAIEMSGDPNFGLLVAAEVRPATFHVVGYAMSCSGTIGRALRRLAFYCRLISDSATATLTESDDVVILEFHFDTGGEPLIYQAIDTVVASIIAYIRWISGEHIRPVEVQLQHAVPGNDSAYRAFFDAPICYEAGRNCLQGRTLGPFADDHQARLLVRRRERESTQ